MLQAIRSKTASIVVKALAGLLIVSFAAWGVEDFISARATETSVATVGDRDIDPLNLEYEISRETARLRQAFGGRLNDAQLAQLGIGSAVLQRLINDAALELKARDLGLLVSDDKVSRSIHDDPSFQGFDEKFSRQRFNEVMRASGLSEAQYIERVRVDIANNQILQAMTGRDAAPKKLSQLLYRHRYAERTAETVLVTGARQQPPGVPTDEQLKKIHEAQKERFTAPEYRKIAFVHLDPSELMDSLSADEEELQTAFEANAARFQKPEQRTVQQIVVTDEETAKNVQKQLAEGRDFIEVATEIADMEKDAVELGTVTRDGLLPDLAEAAFSVEEGTVTETIKTPLGWHILRPTEVMTGVTKSLDDVRDEVTDTVKHEKAVEALYDLSVRFEDEIGGGATLEEAAQTVGLETVSVDAVDRNGKAPSGADAAGLPELGSLLPIAFATEKGVESPLTEAGDKGYFMVRVDDVVEPALRPLADIRDEVTEVWAKEQRNEAARKQADALAQKVTAGTPLSDIAGELGVEVEKVGPITRQDRNKAEQSVVGRIFEIAPGTAGLAKVPAGYKIVDVINAGGPSGGAEKPGQADVDKEIDDAVGSDLAAQAIEAIRQTYGVKINQGVLQQVLEPGTYDPRAQQG